MFHQKKIHELREVRNELSKLSDKYILRNDSDNIEKKESLKEDIDKKIDALNDQQKNHGSHHQKRSPNLS